MRTRSGTPSRRAPEAPTSSDPRSPRSAPFPLRSAVGTDRILTGRYNEPLRTRTRRARRPPRPRSTSWSSAPASPASTSCTAREAGFSVQLLEAGGGVGGTWYWNRYPGARFDSESYTYGYLFSKELFEEWEWQEHFAQQPETERYLNHVVDRFDLRRHIRLGAKVTSAVYDESSGNWTVKVGDGTEFRTRFFVAATGVLSVPYFPDVPGREDFRR